LPAGLASLAKGFNRQWRINTMTVDYQVALNGSALIELRPKDATSLAISQAIREIQSRKEIARERVAALQASKGELFVSGDEKGLAEVMRQMNEAESFMRDADAMLPILRDRFEIAVSAEKIADLRKRLVSLAYAEKISAFVVAWQERYARAAEEIAQILSLEEAAIAAFRPTKEIIQELQSLGVNEGLPEIKRPSQAAGAFIRGQSLGAMVRLPGSKGAPELIFQTVTRRVTRSVPNPVYVECLRRTEIRGTKEITEEVTESVPMAEDKAFWWPKA